VVACSLRRTDSVSSRSCVQNLLLQDTPGVQGTILKVGFMYFSDLVLRILWYGASHVH
jgi:hypothetical protein